MTSLTTHLQVLNAYCVETLVAISEVLSPLPSIAADLAALDMAPLPGDIHTWVPEQTKVGQQRQAIPSIKHTDLFS